MAAPMEKELSTKEVARARWCAGQVSFTCAAAMPQTLPRPRPERNRSASTSRQSVAAATAIVSAPKLPSDSSSTLRRPQRSASGPMTRPLMPMPSRVAVASSPACIGPICSDAEIAGMAIARMRMSTASNM